MNNLGKEKSPYLLQHKDNPVNWFAWGPEALEKARRENKPIFLSVGYSTCYWCHMMEKDSFELEEVGEVLNKDFISIKVDREEHPDVDQIYMEAVLTMTGRGGWPMSVFLTPDLKPFFAGTFFWRSQFLQILEKISDLWKRDPKTIMTSASDITQSLQESNRPAPEQALTKDFLEEALAQYKKNFDPAYGGFGGAPKFPASTNLSFLLRFYQRTKNEDAFKIINKTLDQMATGGIFDHLGGGFHRYSTDERWRIPHFEKMLYDNALLSIIYLEAYAALPWADLYERTARETLDYVLCDMRDQEGGFYSAEDAGEVGKEGEFYTWTEEELRQHLTEEEFVAFSGLYRITKEGNFEHGRNIVYCWGSWQLKNNPPLQRAQKKLFALRAMRPRPHRDEKILTSWNGLMIGALAKGFAVLADPIYLEAAKQAAHFIQKKLYKDGKLLRRYCGGEAGLEGTIEDYSFLIFGLLNLYEIEPNQEWLDWACALQTKQDEIFWDDSEQGEREGATCLPAGTAQAPKIGGGYFFSDPKDPTLIVKKKSFNDGATPSGNSMSAWNCLRLFSFTCEEKYWERGGQLLRIIAGEAKEQGYPAGYSVGLIAADFYLDDTNKVCKSTQ
ncbi:MAG: thioredoxin domain-containing protein [Deltaproteobacteria bacterium]|nr:thioredoxin domain-containing protein [Deltaproteobacteria bacterium]